MRLSTRGRYAVRALLDLTLHMEQGYVSLQAISQREDISLHYLEQIFHKLKKQNIVKSKKGLGGGYLLAEDAKEISIGDVIRAVEGPIAPVYCLDEKCAKGKCPREKNCVTHQLWKRLEERMEGFLDSVSLDQLKEEANTIKSLQDIKAGCQK